MYKYRVFDETIYKFRNLTFADKIENLTSVEGREFRCLIKGVDEKPIEHFCRIIEGPVEV